MLTKQQKWQGTSWLLADVFAIAAYVVLLVGAVMIAVGDPLAVVTGAAGCVVVVVVLALRFRGAWARLSAKVGN